MKHLPRLILTLALLAILVACELPAAASPTPATPTVTETYPAPQDIPSMALLTVNPSTMQPGSLLIDQTFTPTITYTPSNTPTASKTATRTRIPTRTRRPSLTPTITNTPHVHYDDLLIRIDQPGPMSKVISPIRLIAFVAPEYTGVTRIELIGEDGREIYRKVFRTVNVRTYFRVSEEVPFEIPGVAETARLQISTTDASGQIIAFKSVRLLLQSVGEELLTPPYEALEPVALRYPKREAEVSGGEVYVEGEIRPMVNTPLIFELVDKKGAVLGSRIMYVDTNITTYQLFTVAIPYKLAEARTPARLVIRQSDDRLPGMAYLYSLELTLNP